MKGLGEIERVTEHSKLYAVSDMQKVIDAVKAEDVPATTKEAAYLVSMLISSYPHSRGALSDAEWGQTLKRLQEAFQAFPAIVGWKASDVATGLPSCHSFLPKPFDVIDMCRKIKCRLINAKVMAERHIAETKRRADAKPYQVTPEMLERRKRQVATLLGGQKMADAGQESVHKEQP
jgi:hypothetical protein